VGGGAVNCSVEVGTVIDVENVGSVFGIVGEGVVSCCVAVVAAEDDLVNVVSAFDTVIEGNVDCAGGEEVGNAEVDEGVFICVVGVRVVYDCVSVGILISAVAECVVNAAGAEKVVVRSPLSLVVVVPAGWENAVDDWAVVRSVEA
jgi:hypothetical protein